MVFVGLLNSCALPRVAHHSGCETHCGMRAPSNCEELQQLEDRVLDEFPKFSDGWSRADVCNALDGWSVAVHTVSETDRMACKQYGASWLLGFYEGKAFCVAGYTHEGAKVVELLDDEWLTNPLAHELVHVVDIATKGDTGHCAWRERGIKDALKRINGVADYSAPEKDCK